MCTVIDNDLELLCQEKSFILTHVGMQQKEEWMCEQEKFRKYLFKME